MIGINTDQRAMRDEIDRLIAASDWSGAVSLLGRLWRENSSSAVAGFVVSRFERIPQSDFEVHCRVAILRSFTVEPVVPILRAAAAVNGIRTTIHVGAFNAYTQELLDPNSGLAEFNPDVVILALQTRDVVPELWSDAANMSPESTEGVVTRFVQTLQNSIQSFRSRSNAHIVIHNLELPLLPSQGLIDSQTVTGQTASIQRINAELRRFAAATPGVYVLDYDGLVARHGRDRWNDDRKWLSMRMPFASESLLHLSDEWLQFLHPLTGRICKVVVTDLDNTLWGGVIGEDGIDGIQIGTDQRGFPYRAAQQALLDLYHRGILLAVCSKNNREDAMEGLQRHPDMLLRPNHFAAIHTTWNDKSECLREIATELNIGLDAVAFLDDNPLERGLVRTKLPEVTVIELPDDPMEFARSVRTCPALQRLVVSSEDRERGAYYAANRQRDALQHQSMSLEDFYHSLKQEVEIAPLTSETVGRVAQLTQKTNQFNLTTQRYNEQEVFAISNDPTNEVWSVRVRDRFGDNGLVGVVILNYKNAICDIDTFLLSCRVIGRTVETAILSWLASNAVQRGAKLLHGHFKVTAKNAPAKNFFSSHSFQRIEDDGKNSRWELDLSQASISCPEWIALHEVDDRMLTV